MDPFLEERSVWSSVHVRLINAISDYLSPRLLPHFFVDIQQHVYLVTPDEMPNEPITSGIYIVYTQTGSQSDIAPKITPPTLVEPLYELELHEAYIEIRDKRSRTVVTVIELLSPFNKSAVPQGRPAFAEKRKKVIQTDVNWIEIDLLRAGTRPPEVADKSDYYVLLKRGLQPMPYEVWYFDLRDRLPVIAVPLRPPFDDIPLDLQFVFDEMYARAYYAESIDYTTTVPAPRLAPADQQWVQTTIQQWQNAREQG
jgi:hypothetical protein